MKHVNHLHRLLRNKTTGVPQLLSNLMCMMVASSPEQICSLHIQGAGFAQVSYHFTNEMSLPICCGCRPVALPSTCSREQRCLDVYVCVCCRILWVWRAVLETYGNAMSRKAVHTMHRARLPYGDLIVSNHNHLHIQDETSYWFAYRPSQKVSFKQNFQAVSMCRMQVPYHFRLYY